MSTHEKKYFDLHTNGIGYLNRARKIPVRKGPDFLAVNISALHGDAQEPEYTRFDCKVTGADAIKVVEDLMEQINDRDKKVLCAFRLGDLYAETFVFKSGKREGETGISLKSRLLKIHWVKEDGEFVYQADAPASSPDDAEADAAHADNDDLEALLPAEVSLSKADPDFEARKAELKKNGYRFDGRNKVWRLPSTAPTL